MRLPRLDLSLPGRARARRFLRAMQAVLAEENAANRIMLENYARWVRRGDKDGLLMANAQLRESARTLGAGVMLVLPLSFLSFPLLVKLSQKTGVRILPAWFDRVLEDMADVEDEPPGGRSAAGQAGSRRSDAAADRDCPDGSDAADGGKSPS